MAASQEEGSTGEADRVGVKAVRTKKIMRAAILAVEERLAFVFKSIYPSHVAKKRDFIEFYLNKNSKDEIIQSLYDKPPAINNDHVLVRLLSKEYGDLDPN